jgi:hypothetical protein
VALTTAAEASADGPEAGVEDGREVPETNRISTSFKNRFRADLKKGTNIIKVTINFFYPNFLVPRGSQRFCLVAFIYPSYCNGGAHTKRLRTKRLLGKTSPYKTSP